MRQFECVRLTDPADWEVLNTGSPQGSPFLKPSLFGLLGLEAHLWVVRHKDRVLMGGPVLLRNERPIRQPVPFTMYQGPIKAPALVNMPIHTRLNWELDAFDCLVRTLTDTYDLVSMSLNPELRDVRTLLWHNYNNPEHGQFNVTPRYTGIIERPANVPHDDWMPSNREHRRDQVAKAVKNGFVLVEKADPDILVELYRATLSRQGLDVDSATSEMVRRLAETVKLGYGVMTVAERHGERALSAVLFLTQGDTAYYLIGANDPAGRDLGVGTFLVTETIRLLWERGIRRIDVCGVNSPQRGDFKTSLNAVPTVYFDATWTRPAAVL